MSTPKVPLNKKKCGFEWYWQGNIHVCSLPKGHKGYKYGPHKCTLRGHDKGAHTVHWAPAWPPCGEGGVGT